MIDIDRFDFKSLININLFDIHCKEKYLQTQESQITYMGNLMKQNPS